MAMTTLGSTELISCYADNKTKRRTVQALAALQYPQAVGLGVGYRKITYKWNRLLRVYDTLTGEFRPEKVNSIDEVAVDEFLYITLTTLGRVCLPASTRLLTPNGGFASLQGLSCDDAIVISNYYKHKVSKGNASPLKEVTVFEKAKTSLTFARKVYQVEMENNEGAVGLTLANGLIIA
jgi:hypothetical protein